MQVLHYFISILFILVSFQIIDLFTILINCLYHNFQYTVIDKIFSIIRYIINGNFMTQIIFLIGIIYKYSIPGLNNFEIA